MYSTVAQSWRLYRRSILPALRRPLPVGIVHNGGIRRVYECALCGAQVTMDARWPMTVRVSDFMAEHNTVAHVYAAIARRAKTVGLEGLV